QSSAARRGGPVGVPERSPPTPFDLPPPENTPGDWTVDTTDPRPIVEWRTDERSANGRPEWGARDGKPTGTIPPWTRAPSRSPLPSMAALRRHPRRNGDQPAPRCPSSTGA